ncbi:MAG: SusC/RagA family protein [Bacteroidales bacterium 36-12]|nr:MAG: SusC/RagA family protein [Bacteroidales bacterium 36-12]
MHTKKTTLILIVLLLGMVNISLVSAQDKQKVSGRVFGVDGELLIGVSVMEAGTSNGVITDVNGSYNITLSTQKATLKFTYVGYNEHTIEVGSKRIIDVSLLENVRDLDEVVVVGFGSQKKASVVGSITTVEPEKLKLTPSRSISNNLAGMISGVIAVQRSGNPWFNNSDFWIRGVNTFANNGGPMVLIDGVERSLHNIDAEEIESFSVLKDAAASAVYGVRGANGIIMINTKRGKVNPPQVSVRFEGAATSPVKLPEYIGSVKYIELMDEMGVSSFSDEEIQKFKDQSDPDLYPDVNWWNEIAKNNASSTRTNMNVSGGNNLLRYALEIGYFSEDGILKTDESQDWDSSLKVKRYNVRSNVDVNLTKTTLLRVNLGGFLQTKNSPPEGGGDETNFGLFYQASRIPPYLHPTIYSNGQIPRVPFKENPWAWATQRGFQRTNHSNIESLTSVEQDLAFITKGLSAKLTFAFDKFSGNWVTRSKDPDYYTLASGRDVDGNLVTTLQAHGQQFLGYTTGADWGHQSTYLEGIINYGHIFNQLHDVNAMMLYNQRNYDDGSKLPYRTQGSAGRLSYSFARKYIAEFNFGFNGSENFTKGKRFGFFPAAAIGWVVSEEDFMKNITYVLSNLKVRSSWGQAGNSNIGGRRFAYLSTIADVGYYYWGADPLIYRLGRAEGDIGVSGLTWETVTKTNIGLEVGLLKNSINIIVDVFRDNRKDILMQRTNIPGSAGFMSAVFANYGKVTNKGIDASLNMQKQFTKDFYFSAMNNFTFARSRIDEMDEPESIVGTTRARTGHPVGQLFGLVAEGLYTDDDFDANGNLKPGIPVPANPAGLAPGDIKYKDQNNDDLINELDATAIGGSRIPEIIYGLGFNTRYKLVDFGIFFQGAANTWQILGGENWLPGNTLGAGNVYSNVDDRWTTENQNQNAFWPRLSRDALANNSVASTWWLKDMSFLRLKNIELGINFPHNWTKKAGIGNARLFVRGSNVLTFSDFKLWDPELETTDGLKYPIMKSFSAGFSVNFQ